MNHKTQGSFATGLHTKDASSATTLRHLFSRLFTIYIHGNLHQWTFSFVFQNHLVIQFTNCIQSRQLNSVIYSFFRFKEFHIVMKVSSFPSFLIFIVITYFYAGMFGCVLDFSSAGFQWFLTFLIGDLS